MDLIDLIQGESIEKIQDIIESKGILSNSKGLDYEYLNVALQSRRTDVAILLLAKNCRVNKVTKSSNSKMLSDTPLHYAVALGNLDIVYQLLNKEASIVAANSRGNTPLHLAFILKYEAIVDLLLKFLDKTSTYLNCKNNQGLTHLHIACTRKSEGIIHRFLIAGANVDDTVSKNSLLWAGFNALHFAANSKSLEAVRVLVTSSDIDVKAKSTNGQTPFRLAYQEHEDMLVMLDYLSKDSCKSSRREYSRFSNFHMACLRNNPKDVKSFIRKGIDVNSSINCNSYPYPYYTPLLFAIESENEDIIEILLNKQADVSTLTEQGMTPLHLLFYAQYIDKNEDIISKIYAAFDKNMTFADQNGLNLLHIACSRNDMDTVTKILDSGKNVNKIVSYKKRKYYCFTPLHFAVKYQHKEMVELLIKRGADVNANDNWACGTPLHLAFAAGNKELIELLLKNGADPKAVQISDKKTMLHYLVCENDNKKELFEYVELLVVKFGLDINAQNQYGCTPLHDVCQSQNDSKWIELLLEYGSDVNLENKNNETPFNVISEKLSPEKVSGYALMYQHIQKLQALGIPVNVKNEECCQKLISESKKWNVRSECFQEETLKRMKRHMQNEITKIKIVKLTKDVSLRDFLLLDNKEASIYAQNDVLKKIVAEDLTKVYPSYAYLIRLQYRKAIIAT